MAAEIEEEAADSAAAHEEQAAVAAEIEEEAADAAAAHEGHAADEWLQKYKKRQHMWQQLTRNKQPWLQK